jgi:hypothetical protein
LVCLPLIETGSDARLPGKRRRGRENISSDGPAENYCLQPVHGYNTLWYDNAEHQGGYSTHVRAQELFVFHIPEKLKSTDAASMWVSLRSIFE